jgi:YVTN family beta-propeller protein
MILKRLTMKKLFTLMLILGLIAFSLQAQTSNKLYCSNNNQYNNGLTVLDVNTLDTIALIPEAGGYRTVMTKDGKKLYSLGGDDYIYITDAVNDTFMGKYDPSDDSVSSSELEGIAISPDGAYVYVIDESTNAIFVIDTKTDSVIQSGYLDGDEPENCVVSPDGKFLYYVDNTWVTKISTSTFKEIDFVRVGGDAHGVAINADGSLIFSDGSRGIWVIDSAMNVLDTIDGLYGYYMELGGDKQQVYAVNEGNIFTIIDANTGALVDTVHLKGGSSNGVTSDSDGKNIYVGTSSGIEVYDQKTLALTGRAPGYLGGVRLGNKLNTSIAIFDDLDLQSSLIPNPFTDQLRLEIQSDLTGKMQLTMIDILGRTIYQHAYFINSGSTTLNLPGSVLKGLNIGLYLVELRINGSAKVLKVIKE